MTKPCAGISGWVHQQKSASSRKRFFVGRNSTRAFLKYDVYVTFQRSLCEMKIPTYDKFIEFARNYSTIIKMPKILRLSGGISVIVYPGHHTPAHVHVKSKDGSLEVKVDISGNTVKALRLAKNERIKTTSAFTKQALKGCQENLDYLKQIVRKYYEAN